MWRRIGYVVLLTLSNGISAQRLRHRQADSPMSMTSPRTTLTRGQLHHCYIGLPRRRIPPCHNEATQCFFGAICGSGPITSLTPPSRARLAASRCRPPLTSNVGPQKPGSVPRERKAMPATSWKKSPAELVERFRHRASGAPRCRSKANVRLPRSIRQRQHGLGLFQDSVVVRLGKEGAASAVADGRAQQFTPMFGRTMTGYVLVPTAEANDTTALAAWLQQAFNSRSPCRRRRRSLHQEGLQGQAAESRVRPSPSLRLAPPAYAGG